MRSSRPGCQALAVLLLAAAAGAGETTVQVSVRGQPQTLHLYGQPTGRPIVISSGDGGWLRLAVDVAEYLDSAEYFVVGVDSKAYLSSFTQGKKTLAPDDVPKDYRVFVDQARRGRDVEVLLIGVSEGAGLSVRAASEPELQPRLAGVLGLGLPDQNELGWRWKDSLIYLTHGSPGEPMFSAADYIPRLGPVPLAAIHSTHDEYVPLAEVESLMALPGGPKRLWVIDAKNHGFSDRRDELHARLLDALDWLRSSR